MGEITKSDIKKIVRQVIQDEFDKKYLSIKDSEKILKDIQKKITKEDFKNLMVKTFKEQNRYMWEKSSYITNFISKI